VEKGLVTALLAGSDFPKQRRTHYKFSKGLVGTEESTPVKEWLS
jgi:hypothetical protein